eukprot:TRINITY_DN11144_c0_g1_i1.p1 TRINITY_DN11144_c0_g1~~TRINITY_DN11144_c0_g1_i1.p1  ORF type:complete len:250 (+),score=20.17 TRINITY_DN11144_c0_g1_i1:559-1308(+)
MKVVQSYITFPFDTYGVRCVLRNSLNNILIVQAYFLDNGHRVDYSPDGAHQRVLLLDAHIRFILGLPETQTDPLFMASYNSARSVADSWRFMAYRFNAEMMLARNNHTCSSPGCERKLGLEWDHRHHTHKSITNRDYCPGAAPVTGYARARYDDGCERQAQAKLHLGECAACKLTCTRDNIFDFDFNHIDPRNKVYNISQLKMASGAVFGRELAKCNLLCHDCHRKETVRAGVFAEMFRLKKLAQINPS